MFFVSKREEFRKRNNIKEFNLGEGMLAGKLQNKKVLRIHH